MRSKRLGHSRSFIFQLYHTTNPLRFWPVPPIELFSMIIDSVNRIDTISCPRREVRLKVGNGTHGTATSSTKV